MHTAPVARRSRRSLRQIVPLGLASLVLACSNDGSRASAGASGGAGGVPVLGAGGGGNVAAGGAEPDPFANCRGRLLDTDGVLDVDLRAVTISGRVTLSGAPLVDDANGKGSIVFSGGPGKREATVDLGTLASGNYALRLPPGAYDVAYAPGGACDGIRQPVYPCGEVKLIRGASLVTDGVLDVDIPIAKLGGRVTLNGGIFPEEPRGRGSLSFRSSDGTSAEVPLPVTGNAAYTLSLVPGTYDVTFAGNDALCQTEPPPVIPCNSGVVARAVKVATGVLDVDVRSVQVSGNVTLGGSPLPDETADRGALTFVEAGGKADEGLATKGMGTSGPARYAVTLVPGSYDIVFAANAGLCGPGLNPNVPCGGGTVVKGANLTVSGVLDVALSAVTVSGSVNLAGAPLPTETADRGSLVFETEGGSASTPPFGATGPFGYSLRVLASTYDVAFVANPALCGPGAPPQVPCTGGVVLNDVPLAQSGVLDVNLGRVQVQGRITLAGQPLPDEIAERGTLTFAASEKNAVSTPAFPPAGLATYALTLFPGTYDVVFAANAGLCTPGAPLPRVPCVGGVVLPKRTLSETGVLDVDLLPVSVSGAVRLMGGPLPDETSDRGELAFTRIGTADAALSSPLLPAGPATYTLRLLAGPYVISHEANAGLCVPAASPPRVPCASQVLFGCEQ